MLFKGKMNRFIIILAWKKNNFAGVFIEEVQLSELLCRRFLNSQEKTRGVAPLVLKNNTGSYHGLVCSNDDVC